MLFRSVKKKPEQTKPQTNQDAKIESCNHKVTRLIMDMSCRDVDGYEYPHKIAMVGEITKNKILS